MRRGLIAAAILAMLAPSAATQGRQDGTAAAIAERLRTYLQELEPRLGALVAEERFEQILTPISGEGSSVGLSARRLLVSEIGFVRLADEHAWLGHRRVQIVDGRPVRREAPQLQDLFTRTGPEQLAAARRIAAENSRYNLGHPRTTNVPTLPLDLLHPRHAAAYKVTMGGVEQRNGLRVTRLEFAEPGRGSLVAHDERSFVRTVVRAWVEVDSGVLQRAEVTLIPPVAAKENHVVRVDYEMNTKLAVRVPVQLTERFWAGGTGEGKATYRNYRRFETGARIVPPR